jgi:hypothetical protein
VAGREGRHRSLRSGAGHEHQGGAHRGPRQSSAKPHQGGLAGRGSCQGPEGIDPARRVLWCARRLLRWDQLGSFPGLGVLELAASPCVVSTFDRHCRAPLADTLCRRPKSSSSPPQWTGAGHRGGARSHPNGANDTALIANPGAARVAASSLGVWLAAWSRPQPTGWNAGAQSIHSRAWSTRARTGPRPRERSAASERAVVIVGGQGQVDRKVKARSGDAVVYSIRAPVPRHSQIRWPPRCSSCDLRCVRGPPRWSTAAGPAPRRLRFGETQAATAHDDVHASCDELGQIT